MTSAVKAAGMSVRAKLRGEAIELFGGFVVTVVAKIGCDPITCRYGAQQNGRRNTSGRVDPLAFLVLRIHRYQPHRRHQSEIGARATDGARPLCKT